MHGISIPTIVLPKVKIEQLYIKLDKKLIVTIEHLSIDKTTQTDTSLEESAWVIEHFPLFNQLFHSVEIQKLDYDNESLYFSFLNDTFFVTSTHLDTHLQFSPTSRHRFDVTILKADLKDFNLSVEGKASVDLEKDTYTFEGNFTTFGIQGLSILELNKNLLTYHVQTENFTNENLTHLMNFIAPRAELEPLAKAWIHENIIASSYQLNFFEGKFDLKTQEYFPMEMRGSATVKDANVFFAPLAPPAHIDEIGLVFQEDKLIFDAINPRYQDKTVENVNVYLYTLLGKGTGIVVDINATAKLDQDIHKILHAFKINIPIEQHTGESKSELHLNIKFLPYDLNATGLFKITPSDFTLSGVPMHSDFGEIKLDNRLVYLDKTNLSYKDIFDINASGLFDTTRNRFDGMMDINSLKLDFGETHLLNLFHLPQQEALLSIDANATEITLPTLNAKMRFEKDMNHFSLQDLSKLHFYSPLMQQLDIKEGNASVSTKDFHTFEATASLSNLSTPLLDNLKPINEFEIALKTDTQRLDISTTDNKLSLHFDKELTLHVKNLNISIPQGDTPLNIPIKTTIFGENSSLIDTDNNRTILSERYTMSLYKDKVRLNSKHNQSSFEYDEQMGHYSIQANSLDAEETNALLNKHYFYQGDFSLSLEGKDTNTMQGTFIMQKTFIKDLKFFNNFMATINAIPSLLVFSNPNFNSEGYFVNNGYVEFNQTKDAMHIQEIHLRGSSADIFGKGVINLETKELNLALQIRTLKTFSSALDMLPLVGGLILGEDKKISTNITVTGSLDDPKIETHLVADTLMTPVHILKRTLELPNKHVK